MTELDMLREEVARLKEKLSHIKEGKLGELEFKRVTGITISKMTGKMEDMKGITTSCLCNEHCKQYSQNEDFVCSKCYAESFLSYRKNVRDNYERNTQVLTSRMLNGNELPDIREDIFRFESFGDLNNITQCINYFNICKANPETTFALWTKNPFIVEETIKNGESKPDNLVIVLSSLKLNEPIDIGKFGFADKVFTVYTADYALENKIEINCGNKKCRDCRQCYEFNDTVYVNEVLKNEQSKYYKEINNGV